MPASIKYSDNPNEETAFVTQEGGQRSRAVLTAAVDGTIEYPDNPNSTKVMVTVDGVKRRAVAVANIAGGGGGGGDQHNLGYYATQAALEEAHPTAEAGDWAIVGATDTVWIWDTDNSEWVDSDRKGQVTSVNNQTGAVTLGINDVAPSQTGYSGRVLGTDGFVAGWVEPEKIQRTAMPQASEEEVDNIYQYVGTTDANYTNGYFYKCVSDGQNPATYSWEAVEVQASSGGGSTGTTATLAVNDWSSNTQTVNVTGVTASNNIIVAAAPASQADYTAAGILCTAQGAGTLTFTCSTVPSSAITVNVLIFA